MTKKEKYSGSVRIIAGKFRGTKIKVPELEGLRPTPDRIRETLFNWLSLKIPDSRCLDLCAGTGIFGLEAISRQAKEVFFVEAAASLIQQLQENAKRLNISNANILHTDARVLPHFTAPFDIVFMDPPYRRGLVPILIQNLQRPDILAPSAWVCVESEKELEYQPPATWRLHRSLNTAVSAVRLWVVDSVKGIEMNTQNLDPVSQSP